MSPIQKSIEGKQITLKLFEMCYNDIFYTYIFLVNFPIGLKENL